MLAVIYVHMKPKTQILPERHYVTFGYLLSQIHLSVVCRLQALNVRAYYSAG